MKKRYHIVVLREDGKQYQNHVLEWFQVKKRLFVVGGILGALIVGTVGFLVMATWQGTLVHHNVVLAHKERRLRKALQDLGKDLEVARVRLTQSEGQLSQMEKLARQEHLKLNPIVGVGGTQHSSKAEAADKVSATETSLRGLQEGIRDFKDQVDFVYFETQGVSKVLKPRLDDLAHRPSIWPVKGFISSGFGRRQNPFGGMPERHQGIDISARYGSPVSAPAAGLVVFTGWRHGYGKCIEVSHGKGLSTRYAHLSKILVKPGQTVKRYEKIGLVGSTGRSTGAHLHYEVRFNNHPRNPKRFLRY